MSSTTSLKLPATLKATIARIAAKEGKTAHALMVEALQSAMDDATQRDQFHADGEAAWRNALRSNAVYDGTDVKKYVASRIRGGKAKRPQPVALDPNKPIKPIKPTAGA